MWIGVVSLFPEMFEAVTRYGVTGRAVSKGLLNVEFWNPRDYATDKHRTVDDRPYGGGPGMLMKVDTLKASIQAAREGAAREAGRADPGCAVNERDAAHVIYLSPQGRRLDQAGVRELAAHKRLIVVAGRYEGIDERVVEAEVDAEWSIGDYVLSGGELPAMVLLDALSRLVPGVLGHRDSAVEDSFTAGLLDCPHFTRPEVIDGRRVPDVLLSGNHEAIRRWRLKQSLGRTWLRRPDLLERLTLSDEQQRLFDEFMSEHGAQAHGMDELGISEHVVDRTTEVRRDPQ